MHRAALVSTSVLLLLLTTACANHIRFVESETDQSKQTVLEQAYAIDTPGGVIDQPQIELALFKQEVVETQSAKRITKTEELTPYRGGREAFEVPAGLVSLPLSFAFNLIDCLLFGYIPNDVVYGYTHWTFAALNPALNTESSDRKQTRVVEERTEETGRARETVRTALAGATVHAALDGAAPHRIEADANGGVRLELIDLLDPGSRRSPRRLTIQALPKGAAEAVLEESLFLDRSLARSLRLAGPALARAQGGSGEDRAIGIYALDQLGFRRRSAELHDQTFDQLRSDTATLESLQRRLDELYDQQPDVVPLLSGPAAPEE